MVMPFGSQWPGAGRLALDGILTTCLKTITYVLVNGYTLLRVQKYIT